MVFDTAFNFIDFFESTTIKSITLCSQKSIFATWDAKFFKIIWTILAHNIVLLQKRLFMVY